MWDSQEKSNGSILLHNEDRQRCLFMHLADARQNPSGANQQTERQVYVWHILWLLRDRDANRHKIQQVAELDKALRAWENGQTKSNKSHNLIVTESDIPCTMECHDVRAVHATHGRNHLNLILCLWRQSCPAQSRHRQFDRCQQFLLSSVPKFPSAHSMFYKRHHQIETRYHFRKHLLFLIVKFHKRDYRVTIQVVAYLKN